MNKNISKDKAYYYKTIAEKSQNLNYITNNENQNTLDDYYLSDKYKLKKPDNK